MGELKSQTGNMARIISSDMTRVAKIVVAAIGLQVAVAAAQPQRESRAAGVRGGDDQAVHRPVEGKHRHTAKS